MKTWALVSLMSLLVISIGCTRAKRESGSQFTLKTPKFVSQSKAGTQAAVGVPFYMVVNISGEGEAKEFWNWENNCHEECTAAPTPPESVAFSTTTGQKLIQFLAVVEFPGEEGFVFYYGDIEKELVNEVEDIEITAQAMTVVGAEAGFSGRIFTNSTGGPTGHLIMRYTPPNGRPSVDVFKSNIFGGWVSDLTVLRGANLSYVLEETQELVLDRITLDANNILELAGVNYAGNPQVTHIQIPDFYQQRNSNDPREFEKGEKILQGYLGQVPAGYQACYSSSTTGPIVNMYSSASGTDFINWNGNIAGSNFAYVYNGGQGSTTTGVCKDVGNAGSDIDNDNTAFIDHLVFIHDLLGFGGSDQAVGIRGPFTIAGTDFVEVEIDPQGTSPGTLRVHAQVLPGTVGGGALDGFTFYARASEEPRDYKVEDGFACGQMESFGFVEVCDKTPGIDGKLSCDLSLSALGLTTTSTNVNPKVIICPYSGGGVFSSRTYFERGVESHCIGCSGTHGGPPGPNSSRVLDIMLIGNHDQNGSVKGSITDVTHGLGNSDYSFLKKHLQDEANYLAFMPTVAPDGMSVGDRFGVNDFTSAEVSFDGGTTWSALPMPTIHNLSWESAGVISLAGITGMAEWGAPSSDVTFKIRYTLAGGVQQSYGVTSETYTSGNITAVGSTSCGSPGQSADLELLRIDPISLATITETAANFMNGFFQEDGVSNGSDVEYLYRLAWENCPNIQVPIDKIEVSGSTCMGREDIRLDHNQPFTFLISPLDSSGSNCDVTGMNVKIGASYNMSVATEFVKNFGSTKTIEHSIIPAGIAPFTIADTMPILTTTPYLDRYSLSLDFFMGGPGVNLKLHAIAVNSDGQVVGRNVSPYPTNSVTWSTASDSHWTNPITNGIFDSTDKVLLAITASPSAGPASGVLLDDGGSLFGGFENFVHAQTGWEVVAVLNESIDGGRDGVPLFVINDGSNYRIYYLEKSSTNSVGGLFGANMIDITPSGFVGDITKEIMIKGVSVSQGGGFAVANGDKFYLMAWNFDTGQVDMATMQTMAAGEEIVSMDYVSHSGEYIGIFVEKSATPSYVNVYKIPQYDRTNGWSTLSGPVSSLAMTGGDFDATGSDTFQMMRCGERTFVTGELTSLFRAKELDFNTGTETLGWGGLNLTSAGTAITGTHNKLSCLEVQTLNDPIYHFVTYSTTAGAYPADNPNIFIFENGSSDCGGSANTELSPISFPNLSGLNNNGPLFGIKSVSNHMGEGFLITYKLSSPVENVIQFIPRTMCTSGTVNFGGPDKWGSFVTTSGDEFLGISGFQESHNNSDLIGLSVFGKKGQYYKLQFQK